jgi:2-iminobutanoate/2-iminopropanoate deaminase
MPRDKEQIMRETVHTDQAPKAIGPYSQAVKTDRLIFTSGQIAIAPETGQLVTGDVRQQTRQVMKNLQAVLKAAGSSLTQVVKATVFLADIRDFAAFNDVYATYFSSDPPARSAFQVAALPLGALVEVEMVALS